MNWFKRIFAPAPEVKMSEPEAAITAAQLDVIFPGRGDWAVWLDAAMQRYAITTPRRVAHFLAQVGHESAGLTRLDEDLHYTRIAGIRATWPRRFPSDAAAQPFVAKPMALAERVYNTEVDGTPGRSDLGNKHPGDGWLFRGRGLIQVTGRANFTKLAQAFGLSSAEDAVAFARSHEGAALSAGDYWDRCGINALADAGGLDAVPTVTRAINSKLIGLADRQERFQRAAKVLGV
jgi:putative chitinase